MSNSDYIAPAGGIEKEAPLTKIRRGAGLPLDPARYRHELADLDLTDEQANELLRTLWDIMRIFVELGIRVDIVDKIVPPQGSTTVDSDHAETIEQPVAGGYDE